MKRSRLPSSVVTKSLTSLNSFNEGDTRGERGAAKRIEPRGFARSFVYCRCRLTFVHTLLFQIYPLKTDHSSISRFDDLGLDVYEMKRLHGFSQLALGGSFLGEQRTKSGR